MLRHDLVIDFAARVALDRQGIEEVIERRLLSLVKRHFDAQVVR